MHKMRSGAVAMMLGLSLLLVGGCASADRHVYETTPLRSATVTLIDALDNEPLWSQEIPPEHRLVVRLQRRGEPRALRVTGQPATSMKWALFEAPRTSINDSRWRNHLTDGDLELDGRPVRLQVDYEPTARRDPAPDAGEQAPGDAEDPAPADAEASDEDQPRGDQAASLD